MIERQVGWSVCVGLVPWGGFPRNLPYKTSDCFFENRLQRWSCELSTSLSVSHTVWSTWLCWFLRVTCCHCPQAFDGVWQQAVLVWMSARCGWEDEHEEQMSPLITHQPPQVTSVVTTQLRFQQSTEITLDIQTTSQLIHTPPKKKIFGLRYSFIALVRLVFKGNVLKNIYFEYYIFYLFYVSIL